MTCLLLFITGCGTTSTTSKDDKFIKLSTNHSAEIDQQTANQAKDILSFHEEITDIYAVNSPQNMIIGIKIYHHDRFKLKKIRKRLQKEIDDKFPKSNNIVSTDQKIILELQRLEDEINSRFISQDEMNKKIKNLMKSAKDQT